MLTKYVNKRMKIVVEKCGNTCYKNVTLYYHYVYKGWFGRLRSKWILAENYLCMWQDEIDKSVRFLETYPKTRKRWKKQKLERKLDLARRGFS